MAHPSHHEGIPSNRIFAQGLAITLRPDDDKVVFRHYYERYEVQRGKIKPVKCEGEPTLASVWVAKLDEVLAGTK